MTHIAFKRVDSNPLEIQKGEQTFDGRPFSVRARHIWAMIPHDWRIIQDLLAGRPAEGSPLRWANVVCIWHRVVEAAVAVFPPGSQIVIMEPITNKAGLETTARVDVR